MGLDCSVHVGPYVECKTQKEDTEISIRTCVNSDCEEQNKEISDKRIKFCSSCGSPIWDAKAPIKANKVNRHHLIDEMKDAMMPPLGDSFADWMDKNNVDIWTGNRHRPDKKARSFHFDPKYDEYCEEITHAIIAADIAEFTNQYRKEISVLRKAYGLENVTIKWGVIRSVS